MTVDSGSPEGASPRVTGEVGTEDRDRHEGCGTERRDDLECGVKERDTTLELDVSGRGEEIEHFTTKGKS